MFRLLPAAACSCWPSLRPRPSSWLRPSPPRPRPGRAGEGGRRRRQAAREGGGHHRVQGRHQPQVRGQDQQEGRVHPDRPGPGQLQGHGVRRTSWRSHSTLRVRLGDPTEVNFMLAPGAGTTAPKEDAAKGAALKACSTRASRPARPATTTSAIAKFTEALAMVPELLRLLLQHRLRLHAEEGLRPGRGGVPEGDRDEGRTTSTPTTASRRSTTRRRSSTRPARPAARPPNSAAAAAARRAARRAGRVDAEYNQGVIDWNAGQDRGGRRTSRR